MPRVYPLVAWSLVLLAPLACDDKSSAPDEPASETAETVVPATQSVAVLPRTPLELRIIPFVVDVPTGWKVETHEIAGRSLSMLEGPLDGDEARITLAIREEMSGEILKRLIERTRREAAADPAVELGVNETSELRQINRRRVTPASATQASEDAPTPNSVDWRVSLFLPSGVRYQQYEIRFIGLSADTFHRNKALLDDIVNSIRPEAGDRF